MNVQPVAILVAVVAPFLLISSALHMSRNVNNSKQYFATAFALLICPNIAILLALVGSESAGIVASLLFIFLGPIFAFIGSIYFIAGHVRGRFADLRYDAISLAIVGVLAAGLAFLSGALG